jgi:hypothetical protein
MTTVSWLSITLIAGCAVSISGRALADPCEAVLKYQAFDINDQTTYNDLRQSAYGALCKTGWSSLQDYNHQTGNFDTNGKYLEIFSGGTHGDETQDKNRFTEDY